MNEIGASSKRLTLSGAKEVALAVFLLLAPFSANSATPLSFAHAFPVPFMPSRGDQAITFAGLSAAATIRIYTLGGALLRTLTETDGDGVHAWDVTTSEGNVLSSGIYLYHIESPTDEKMGKLVVLR